MLHFQAIFQDQFLDMSDLHPGPMIEQLSSTSVHVMMLCFSLLGILGMSSIIWNSRWRCLMTSVLAQLYQLHTCDAHNASQQRLNFKCTLRSKAPVLTNELLVSLPAFQSLPDHHFAIIIGSRVFALARRPDINQYSTNKQGIFCFILPIEVVKACHKWVAAWWSWYVRHPPSEKRGTLLEEKQKEGSLGGGEAIKYLSLLNLSLPVECPNEGRVGIGARHLVTLQSTWTCMCWSCHKRPRPCCYIVSSGRLCKFPGNMLI